MIEKYGTWDRMTGFVHRIPGEVMARDRLVNAMPSVANVGDGVRPDATANEEEKVDNQQKSC
jgi:hypothetical protein